MNLTDLPPHEQAFVHAIAKVAAQHQMKPSDAIRLFGTMVRTLVAYEQQVSDRPLEELTEEAFQRLFDGYGALGTIMTRVTPGEVH